MTKAYAAITNPVVSPFSLGDLIADVLSFAILIGFILTFFLLLRGALAWISSGGDEGKLEAARNRITLAIIGLVLLVSVWVIFTFVGDFVGLDPTNLPIPSLLDN